jgi:hypothetical protein
MKTTFREILKYKPCKRGFAKLCNNLLETNFPEDPESWSDLQLDDEQLNREVTILQILESNGVKDTFWALRTQEYKDYCLIAADVAESVLHIFEDKYPDDERPRKAIESIREWHSGKTSIQELIDYSHCAHNAHVDADDDAAHVYDVYDAAYDAAYAASTVSADKQWEKNEEILRKHLEMKNGKQN